MVILDIAVPVPLRQTFSYQYSACIKAGIRVKVPFGSRELVGIVIGEVDSEENENLAGIKPVIKVLDENPLIDNHLLELGKWLASYYHFPIGETLFTVLPPWLRKAKSDSDILPIAYSREYSITTDGQNALLDGVISRDKHREILAWLSAGNRDAASARQKGYEASLKTLRKKQWVEYGSSALVPKMYWLNKLDITAKPFANEEQAIAIGVLSSQSSFAISLLEGVTGSGKTEVYLQLIETVLAKRRQILILLPEIGLTPQSVSRFEKRFGCEVGVLHSQISDRQRSAIWLKAKLGVLPIVIGTRSAVFTSFLDLGMIIIDEEHDDALKQQDGLSYHARDVAAIRAKKLGIPLVLGTATPSLESLHNAISGRYQHLHLTQRAAQGKNVSQHILDIKHHTIHAGLSEVSIQHMRHHLDAGNQVLLFLNRRGYSPILMCHDCGHIEMCRSCERPMTWHKKLRRLQCHHCEIQRAVPISCEHCQSHNMMPEGVGTEQLSAAVQTMFPMYPVTRIDRDSTRTKTSLKQRLDEINDGTKKILIGTQMLAKGHHFPNVTLVIILDVDAALFSSDPRAQEKLIQLVTQVSGRAGRETKPGEMILQTHHPDHPILQEVINNGYDHGARLLLSERKSLASPPYVAQAILRCEFKEDDLCNQLLKQVKESLSTYHSVSCIGPVPALFEKKRGRFRYILVLRSYKRASLHAALHHVEQLLAVHPIAKKVRWSLDIDAIDIT